MVHDWKMEAYWRLPVFLQNLSLSLYGWKLDRLYYGGNFRAEVEATRARGWASSEALEAWQMGEFRRMVSSAAAHVPHYRGLGPFDVESFRAWRDLARFPILERQAVRQHEAEFRDERLDPKTLFRDKTSGSTGTSLTVSWPVPAVRKFQAIFEVRVRNAAGVDRSVPRAMLGGRPILPGGRTEPPFWRYNAAWKQLYLSSYHVSPRTAPMYAKALRDSGVRWITGYGSAIGALAESALAANVEPVPMECAVVSGDTLQPGMRLSIERFFRCKCYDSYGQVEGFAMAMECREGRLHLVPEVGIVEILREDGRPCAPGEVGEIVASGLVNDGMPFLRCRSGDLAAFPADPRCPCGSVHTIIEKLEGRVDDYLRTADGRSIGRLSTAMKRSPSIHSAQIVQDRPDHAFLLIRPGSGYKREDAFAVRDDILERIGAFDFDILEVDEIPKTPRGKARLVVRLEDRPELEPAYREVLGRARTGPAGPIEGRPA